MVFWLGQPSKHSGLLILPAFFSNNQHVTHPKLGTNNRRLDTNNVSLGLVSGQVCYNVLPLIIPMLVHVLEFGGDYTSQFHNNIMNEFPLNGLKNTFWF